MSIEQAKIRIVFFLFVLLYSVGLVVSIDWGLPSQERIELLTFGKTITEHELEVINQERIWCSSFHSIELARRGGINRGKGTSRETLGFPEECVESVSMSFRRFLLFGVAQDESRSFYSLSQMKPSEFDLHPRRFENGTAYLYPVGLLLYLTNKLGYWERVDTVNEFFKNPNEIKRIYVIARFFSAIALLGCLVTLFRIGERFFSPVVGLVSVVAFCGLSLVMFFGVQARIHIAATLWVTLGVYWLLCYHECERLRKLIFASAAFGLAIGTGLHAILATIAIPMFVLGTRCSIPTKMLRLIVAGIVIVLSFVLTNPYALLDLDEFLKWWAGYLGSTKSGGHGYAPNQFGAIVVAYIRELGTPIAFVRAPFFVFLIGGVVFGLLSQRRHVCILAITVLVGCLVAATIGKASGRFVMFLWPMICLLASIYLIELARKSNVKIWGRSLIALIVFLPSYGSIAGNVVGLYKHKTDDDRHKEAVECLFRANIDRSTKIGMYAFPRPNSMPPFPFLGSEIIILSESHRKTADIVVIRENSDDEKAWHRDPNRTNYARICRIRGAYNPLHGYLEQTVSIYQRGAI